jgi:hypothetical protein
MTGDRDMNIGIVSDTHGLIRQEVLDALRGSDMIMHAGDIGKKTSDLY